MAEEKVVPPIRGGDPKYTWDDTVAAIGKDFSGGKKQVADEAIEYSTVMRCCEPWEIGNPIYWSEQVAKQLGYRGVVAPISSLQQPFLYSGRWKPGDKTRFPSQEPNAFGLVRGDTAAGRASSRATSTEIPMPIHHHSVGATIEFEYFEPACVGDRLTGSGDKLVNVVPKRTKVGFGVFITRESRIENQRGELVARVRHMSYTYNRDGEV